MSVPHRRNYRGIPLIQLLAKERAQRMTRSNLYKNSRRIFQQSFHALTKSDRFADMLNPVTLVSQLIGGDPISRHVRYVRNVCLS
jgi:hypothetical protein